MVSVHMTQDEVTAITESNNDPLKDLLLYASAHGLTITGSGDNKIMDGVSDMTKLRWSTAKLVLAKNGGQVKGLPAWFEIDDADYEKDVPAVIDKQRGKPVDPGDPGGAKHPNKKWSEWKDQNHEHRSNNGKKYIGSNALNGRDLDATDLKAIEDSGVTIVDTVDYRAKNPNPVL